MTGRSQFLKLGILSCTEDTGMQPSVWRAHGVIARLGQEGAAHPEAMHNSHDFLLVLGGQRYGYLLQLLQ